MQLQKFFDPLMVARTLVLRSPSTKSRKNEDEASVYALDLAYGLTIWSTIDSIAILTMAFISLFVPVPIIVVLIFLLFGVGCPLVMTAGMMLVGRPQQLTFKRTWNIVRDYFLE